MSYSKALRNARDLVGGEAEGGGNAAGDGVVRLQRLGQKPTPRASCADHPVQGFHVWHTAN